VTGTYRIEVRYPANSGSTTGYVIDDVVRITKV
jgi:hypothetical protein